MGAWYDTIHLRTMSAAKAIEGLAVYFDSAGTPAGEPAPLDGCREPLAAIAEADGWTVVLPSPELDAAAVPRFLQLVDARGVHLFTRDSDTWGVTVIDRGTVLATHESPADDLARAFASALGVSVDAGRIDAILRARPLLAEEAMEELARLIGIRTAMNALRYAARGELHGLDPAAMLCLPAARARSTAPSRAEMFCSSTNPAPAYDRNLRALLAWARETFGGGASHGSDDYREYDFGDVAVTLERYDDVRTFHLFSENWPRVVTQTERLVRAFDELEATFGEIDVYAEGDAAGALPPAGHWITCLAKPVTPPTGYTSETRPGGRQLLRMDRAAEESLDDEGVRVRAALTALLEETS